MKLSWIWMSVALAGVVATGCTKSEDKKATEAKKFEAAQAALTKPEAPVMSAPVAIPEPPRAPATLLVTVNGMQIKQADVNTIMDMAIKNFEKRGLPPEQVAMMKGRIQKQILDSLVLKKILADAVAEQKMTVAPAEVDEALAKIRERLPASVNFEEVLKEQGKTMDEVHKDIGQELQFKKLIDAQTDKLAKPTDLEIRAYYDDNKTMFDLDENVTARHILIAVKETATPEEKAAMKAKAEDIRSQLVAAKGTNFAELAMKYSDDPGSKAKGGDLGAPFTREMMVQPFADAAFALKTNEISQVVETKFGYHVIQASEHQPKGTMSFDKAKGDIADVMLNERKQKAAMQFIESLRAKAKIDYADKSMEPQPEPMPPMMPMPVPPPAAK